jgi:transcriptional regulator with XRE-family HTH domain
MRTKGDIAPIEQYIIDFVRELRLKHGLTQEDIGNILEISRSFVGDIERGTSRAKYNLIHINALADYFGMSPREFLPDAAIQISKKRIAVKPGNKTDVRKRFK